jgi:membrane protease subunit HflK
MTNQHDFPGGAPDPRDVIARVTETFRRNVSRIGPIVLGALALLALARGVYMVGPGEQGIVRTFGKVTGRTASGLHFAWPLIQQADVVNMKKVRRVEVGFRGDKKEVEEARMLTGDENIVEAQMIVQYQISDAVKFLFRLSQPEEALRASAEVALRSVVGRTRIDSLLTKGRETVQQETHKLLQELLDQYDSGIIITEVKLQAVDPPEDVKQAFDDVVRAREHKERLINEAKGYREDRIPRARGEAERLKREAEAYETERVQRAMGDAARFESQYTEYTKAKRVTRDRLYIETMEQVLSKVQKKVLVDDDVSKNSMPVLQLGAPQGAALSAPPILNAPLPQAAPMAPPPAQGGK